ncbi:MAG TPA: hypothetical protein PKL49_05530 [Steroidobacteraceae bacterium]|nr:hypothetical protein [Steroidobacteraceae bacterium]HNS27181.1 hypothetical protein [Steroidobacteraceae bacterium]
MRNVIVALLLGVVLAGCRTFGGGGSCNKPREYTNSESIPALKVPPGMDVPNTRGALRIPELDTEERVRGPGDPCLDEPPPFAPPPATPQPQA